VEKTTKPIQIRVLEQGQRAKELRILKLAPENVHQNSD